MGTLEKIFSDPDLKCAAGLAALPLVGPASLLACRDAVEKRLVPQPVPTEPCKPGIPPERCEAGRQLGRQILKKLRIFQGPRSQIQDKISEKILRDVSRALLVMTPFFPVAVGLERFGHPLYAVPVSAKTVSEIGGFAADVAMSSALFGAGAMGARFLNQGARKAAAAVTNPKPTLEAYLEKIGAPGALLFFPPLF